jgi:hypothetical protein
VPSAFIYLKVEFTVDCFTLCVNHFESVRTIAVHEAVAVGCAAIRKQEGHLVSSFGAQSNKVPKHVWILQVSDGVAFLSVDETREKDGITKEENWSKKEQLYS